MKVIDLLNKIVKGEEVPKKIRWGVNTLIYDKEIKDYRFDDRDELYTDRFISVWGGGTTNCFLNDKVEIIEEEQDIEELNFKLEEKQYVATENGNILELSSFINEFNDKINELIKAVNELKNGI